MLRLSLPRVDDTFETLDKVGFSEQPRDSFHANVAQNKATIAQERAFRRLAERYKRLEDENWALRQGQQQPRRSPSIVSVVPSTASRADGQSAGFGVTTASDHEYSSISTSESSEEDDDDDDSERGADASDSGEDAASDSDSDSSSEASNEDSIHSIPASSPAPSSSKQEPTARQATPFGRTRSPSSSSTTSSTSASSSDLSSRSGSSSDSSSDEEDDEQPTPSIEDYPTDDAVAMPPPPPPNIPRRDPSLPSDYMARQSPTPSLFPGLASRGQSRDTNSMFRFGSVDWSQAGFPPLNTDGPGHIVGETPQTSGNEELFEDFVQYDTEHEAPQMSVGSSGYSSVTRLSGKAGSVARQSPIACKRKMRARASTDDLAEDDARPTKRCRTRSPSRDPRPKPTAVNLGQPPTSRLQVLRHVLDSRASSQPPVMKGSPVKVPGNHRFRQPKNKQDLLSTVLSGGWPDLEDQNVFDLAAFVANLNVALAGNKPVLNRRPWCWLVLQAAAARLAAKESGLD